MTDDDANKDRNRQIARNEEARRATGSLRVSSWAIVIVVIIGAVLFTLGWIASR